MSGTLLEVCVWQGFILLNKFHNLHTHLEVGDHKASNLPVEALD